jgi:hypothetical protein
VRACRDSACTRTSAFPLGPAGNWRNCAAMTPARRWRRSVCHACRTGGCCTASGTAGATERRTWCSTARIRGEAGRLGAAAQIQPGTLSRAACSGSSLEETRCSSSRKDNSGYSRFRLSTKTLPHIYPEFMTSTLRASALLRFAER